MSVAKDTADNVGAASCKNYTRSFCTSTQRMSILLVYSMFSTVPGPLDGQRAASFYKLNEDTYLYRHLYWYCTCTCIFPSIEGEYSACRGASTYCTAVLRSSIYLRANYYFRALRDP